MLRADNGSSALVADTPQVVIAPLNVQPPSIDLDLTATMSFLVVSGLVVLGALCFLALRCVPALVRASCEYQSATSGTSIPSGAARNGNGLELTITTSATSPDCGMAQTSTTMTMMLDDGSFREGHNWAASGGGGGGVAAAGGVTGPAVKLQQHWPEDNPAGLTLTGASSPIQGELPVVVPAVTRPNKIQSSGGSISYPRSATARPFLPKKGGLADEKKIGLAQQPRLYPFLMVIAFWASYVLSGPLSPVKACAFFPQGSDHFLLGVFGSDLLSLLACLWSSKTTVAARIHLTIAMTSLATILFAYFLALIGFSPSSSFNETGQWLTVLSWPVVVGLLVYSRATIGVSCREYGLGPVTTYAFACQLGAAVGALHVLGDLTVSRVFRESHIV